ncbi:hypothetical protein [Accumulibacter sp.]|uniref:hypothetical protein n=1 Tax=Accumulibacter sp. TaxID=2053492 RepID=UPI001AD33F0A|nr:hypothetical protein [Accumulibacter sp.]MBN8453495.1 hypothetical protein [Accumulibacter sp.]MBO3705039.1 hypothetical protein [Candidatus Accumulibacter conexus]
MPSNRDWEIPRLFSGTGRPIFDISEEHQETLHSIMSGRRRSSIQRGLDAIDVRGFRSTTGRRRVFVGATSSVKGKPMRVRVLAFAVAFLLPVLAAAQPKPDPAEDEDLKFEESIRNFGFVSGAAYQCLPETERSAHDREVLKAYSGLVRLFGTDRAFFYAAAFGAGTSMGIEKARCAAYIEDFRAAMRSGSRGQ